MSRISGTHARKPPSLALLVWITISGTLPMHVFVPALPAVAAEFQASAGAVQLTITLYIVGLAIGQLVYGPLSDRYGRRPVLLLGLTLYTGATLAAAFAGSLSMLIVDRVAQALGGCAGLVLGRAIARDNVVGHHVIRRLATLSVVMSFAPAMAPFVGAQLTVHFGWRSILYVLGAANVLMLVVSALTLAETHHRRGSMSARAYASSYAHLARSRVFVAFAIGGAAATTGFYAFVSASPFLLMQRLGVSTQAFGLIYVTIVGGVACGGTLANFVSRRVRESTVLRIAGALLLGSSTLLGVAYLAGVMTVAVITCLMVVFVIGAGLTSPYAIAGAINIEPDYAGAASGLYGFTQMAYGALCTAIIALGHNDPVRPMVATLVASSILSIVAFELARRGRRTRPARVAAD